MGKPEGLGFEKYKNKFVDEKDILSKQVVPKQAVETYYDNLKLRLYQRVVNDEVRVPVGELEVMIGKFKRDLFATTRSVKP